MKNISKYLIIIVSLFFAFACTDNKTNETSKATIKVEMSSSPFSVPLSEIAGFSILPLPTSDSLLIGEIRKIHSGSEYIYISDGTSLYKFAYDGSLVGQISKSGNGPDEYSGIDDFQINEEGNALILSRNMKALLLYSWDNKLMKKTNIFMWGMNFCLLDNKILLYTGNEKTSSNCQLHLLDMVTGQIEKSYKPLDERKVKYLHVRGNNVFRVDSDGDCVFTEMFNDSIYRITKDSYLVENILDWDGRNVPASFYNKNYANVMEFFQELHKVGTYAYGINLYSETPSSYWVSYYYKQNCFLAIVPKNDVGGLVCDKLILDTSFGNYPVELSNVEMFVQDSGNIIIPLDVMSVKEYFSSSQKDIVGRDLKDVSDDSNPYLLIISPKK